MKENYITPDFITRKIDVDNKNYIFIETLELSVIDVILSFSNIGQNKVFQKYLELNPVLSTLLSTISNIDKSNIRLEGHVIKNVYGKIGDIFSLVKSNYSQHFLKQLLNLFGSIEILGNPGGLINNLGSGVEDFFTKPMEGIVKGPLEGVKGLASGSLSLVTHTVDGTFTSAEKITSNISKGLLSITQDEEYIKQREKSKYQHKPNNFVEGLGYGVSSVAEGIFSGVKGVFTKPIEGASEGGIGG